MFTFINLSLLTALIAVGLPLLIHLFNRHKKKKVTFSSIRFLKLLEKQRLKRLKLYEYLLIIIRTLIILMLVFAFARPTLTTKPVFSSKGARTTAVIILDSGINMRRYDDSGNRYLRALEILAQIEENFKPEDQVYLISSNDPDQVLNSTGDIQEQQASFQGGKWESTFQTSLNLFKEHPNFNQELYIISDFQFQQNNYKQNLQLFSDAHIYFIKVGDLPVLNISIDTVDIKSQILEINKPINFDIYLKSSSNEGAHPVEIHMFVNDKRVSHRRVLMGSNQTKVVPMSFLPQNSGFTSGYIEISDDDLLADNRYYFVVNIPSEIKILFVDDQPSPFLLAAMQSLSNHTNISLNINKYNTWAGHSFQKYDVIWLSNIPKLSTQIQNRLKSFSEKGGSLLLMPGLNTIPSEFNTLAKRLSYSLQITEIIETKSPKEFYSFTQPDLEHPLFSGLFRSIKPDIEDPRFYRYFKTIIPTEIRRIFSFQNGDPFLVQFDNNEGRSFFFSSYIEDGWTDFQYRGLFLPLLSRLMYYAISASSQSDLSGKVGKPRIVTTKDHGSNEKFYLYDDNENRSTIVPKILNQTYQFKLSRLNKPGLYTIKTENQLISTIPVNCELKIIDEPHLDLESIFEEVPQTGLFSENQEFAEVVKEARFGMELWKFFILFSLILIITELFLIKNMEGKKRT